MRSLAASAVTFLSSHRRHYRVRRMEPRSPLPPPPSSMQPLPWSSSSSSLSSSDPLSLCCYRLQGDDGGCTDVRLQREHMEGHGSAGIVTSLQARMDNSINALRGWEASLRARGGVATLLEPDVEYVVDVVANEGVIRAAVVRLCIVVDITPSIRGVDVNSVKSCALLSCASPFLLWLSRGSREHL